MKISLLSIFCFFLLEFLFAPITCSQDISEMQVIEGSAEIANGYFVATQPQNRDANGKIAGAIMVETDLQGLAFESGLGIIRSDNKPGQYILFVSEGEKRLRVLSPNHVPLNIFLPDIGIRIKSGQTWKIQITGDKKLELLPVIIRTTPKDAVRFIDGENKGTGETLSLPFGSHKIRLEKQGFSALERTIEVTEQKAFFEFTLKEVELQTLTLRSEPSGAVIFIDGIEKGQTPKGLFQLPGKYQVKWSLSGYVEIEKEIEVKENEQNEFTVTLEKNTGILEWTTNPTNATVRINREDQGSKNRAELAPGRYVVEIEAEGYDSKSETIEIERGQTVKKNWSLVQQTGRLQFSVDPVDAKVTLSRNNRTVESWQGLKILKDLPVGEYEFVAELNGYQPQKELQLGKIEFNDDKRDSETFKSIDYSLFQSLIALFLLLVGVLYYFNSNNSRNSKIKSDKTNLKVQNTEELTDTITSATTVGDTMTNSIGMEFVLIPSGRFEMGSNNGEDNAKPVHRVSITKPFYIGKYEVTQAEWESIMGNNPSNFKGANNPVEYVSWSDVQEFITKLNRKEEGQKYRLPTEAEWEYAARAGTSTKWSFGDDESQLSSYAWYDDNSGNKTHPVGQKKPNPWGLHDMHGNVWEWVQDRHGSDYYQSSPSRDPQGPSSGSFRVYRGGGWNRNATFTRSAYRDFINPEIRYSIIGFRLVCLQ